MTSDPGPRPETEVRREKLDRLRASGREPFALRFDRDATAASVKERFGHLKAGEESGQWVRVAGRLVLFREMGKLAFGVLRDGTGDVQLFLSRDTLGDEAFAGLADLDLGDWIGAEGEVMVTR